MHINIIGKGKGWRDAPDEGITWGVNDLCCRRDVSVVFDMHKRSDSPLYQAIEAYVNSKKVPLITLESRSGVPTAIEFPLYLMHTDYFTNSISYMLAYAIYLKATVIDLYGCFMGTKTEYAYQKPCIEYWIGYARGKGIEVNTHSPTSLMRIGSRHLYGYDKLQEKF